MAMAGKRRILPLAVFLVGLLILGGALMLQLREISTANAPAPSAIGGPFTLTDQNGKTVTEKDFKGKPTLIFFGFTRCPDICPTTLFEITEMLNAAGKDAERVNIVFVSVDPDRDTPESLKEYIESFDNRIVGLSGTPQQIEEISKLYRVYARKIPTGEDDYTMDHTAIIYLMDKEGRFINAFNLQRPPEESVQELKKYL